MRKINLFWFRRDLRLHDNAGFYHALKGDYPVLPIFIFDTQILDKLEHKEDARVEFLQKTLTEMSKDLKNLDSTILVRHGNPTDIWKDLLETYDVQNVFTNRDYEIYAKERDEAVEKMLAGQNIGFHAYKDHLIFDRSEVVKSDGDPYVVFTPYSRVWRSKLEERKMTFTNEEGKKETTSFYFAPYPNAKYFDNLYKTDPMEVPSLADLGFKKTDITIPDKIVSEKTIKNYDETRNFPALEGTSRLGIHFRHGTVSIREEARRAAKLNAVFLTELIWRDFYAQILDHFPHVEKGPFREKYAEIEWRNNEEEFAAWRAGKTGYPLVDAGMRQMNETGYMHNRVRMVVASFLTKHLLINWQWGEAYFAEKLLDYELASNNGGWQWAAGCGTDAAPYFRIFNPTAQLKKFDKNLVYTKEWIPEYGTDDYPDPIVDHKEARERCLRVYKEALG